MEQVLTTNVQMAMTRKTASPRYAAQGEGGASMFYTAQSGSASLARATRPQQEAGDKRSQVDLPPTHGGTQQKPPMQPWHRQSSLPQVDSQDVPLPGQPQSSEICQNVGQAPDDGWTLVKRKKGNSRKSSKVEAAVEVDSQDIPFPGQLQSPEICQ